MGRPKLAGNDDDATERSVELRTSEGACSVNSFCWKQCCVPWFFGAVFGASPSVYTVYHPGFGVYSVASGFGVYSVTKDSDCDWVSEKNVPDFSEPVNSVEENEVETEIAGEGF